jgi:hypothetical protein
MRPYRLRRCGGSATAYAWPMNAGAPIEVYGYHDDLDVILARREGEPTFIWVQDMGDAFQAAASRGVDVTVTRTFRDELVANGDLPPFELQGLRVI